MDYINFKAKNTPIESKTFLLKRNEYAEIEFLSKEEYYEETYKIEIFLDTEAVSKSHCTLHLGTEYIRFEFHCVENSKEIFLTEEFVIGTEDHIEFNYEIRIHFRLMENALFAIIHTEILKVPKD